jgi:hypothetical protein
MIMTELTKEKYKQIPFFFTKDNELAYDIYIDSFIKVSESDTAEAAYKLGRLEGFFYITCKHTFINHVMKENRYEDIDVDTIPCNENEQERSIFSRLLENDLSHANNIHELYCKKLIKIYLMEGSFYKAQKATGIRIEIFKTAVNDYINNNNISSRVAVDAPR